jgi:hypothetical protein
MAHLKDLQVEWVSLVKTAAVRDPSEPTQAQRFLLLKSADDDERTAKMAKKNKLAKVDSSPEDLADALTDLNAAVRKNEVTDPRGQERVRKGMHDAQLAYLRAVSPAAAAAYEARNADPIRLDDTALIAKAEEIRKRDPGLSQYDAMRQAMDRDAQAAYLASVRG